MQKDSTDQVKNGLNESDRELLENSGLSPALKRTIKAKIGRGELDEIDHDIFEENLKKAIKKRD